jgi:FkbM family methyltransferase
MKLANSVKLLYYLYKYPVRKWVSHRLPTLWSMLDCFSITRKEVFLVQIGANDGVTYDPFHFFIKRDGWSGILVEPQKEVFNKLQQNYRDNDRIICENVAIAAASSVQPLYKLAFTDALWATGLASFNQETIMGLFRSGYIQQRAAADGIALPEDASQLITTEQVRTRSVHDLLTHHGVRQVDLLVVDTEGFDYEILKMADLPSLKPDMIVFESVHLAPDVYQECVAYLRGLNYKVYLKDENTVALQKNVRNAVLLLLC